MRPSARARRRVQSPAVAAASLPEPMLARSGPIPARGQWAFEVKWDGFRALVSTRPYRVRSRRGSDMTPFLPEFSELRPHGVYDAELIAFGEDGRPDFPLVCERLLHRWSGIP